MSDQTEEVERLMTAAQVQLDEHSVWLMKEISKLPAEVAMEGAKGVLTWQCTQIKLRMVQAAGGAVSIVYSYPDELHAFLTNQNTPKHLRDTLAGSHDVTDEKPAFTAVRES